MSNYSHLIYCVELFILNWCTTKVKKSGWIKKGTLVSGWMVKHANSMSLYGKLLTARNLAESKSTTKTATKPITNYQTSNQSTNPTISESTQDGLERIMNGYRNLVADAKEPSHYPIFTLARQSAHPQHYVSLATQSL